MEHYHYVHNYYTTVKKTHSTISLIIKWKQTALLHNIHKWMVFAKKHCGRHIEVLIHSIFGIYGIYSFNFTLRKHTIKIYIIMNVPN
jgi:hypothetical protein